VRKVGFVAAGVVLCALPFLSLGAGVDPHTHGQSEPHMDHDPRHGGLVLMVGDHHLEVVDHGDAIEVYTTDARRRPLEPAKGRIVLDETQPLDLSWEHSRLVVRDVPPSKFVDCHVTLADGTVLEITVPRR
jgi:hypothetical protein